MKDFEILGLVFTPANDASHKFLSMTYVARMSSWVPDWTHGVNISGSEVNTKAAKNCLLLYNPCLGTRIEAGGCGYEFEYKFHAVDGLCIEIPMFGTMPWTFG